MNQNKSFITLKTVGKSFIGVTVDKSFIGVQPFNAEYSIHADLSFIPFKQILCFTSVLITLIVTENNRHVDEIRMNGKCFFFNYVYIQ